LPGKNKDSRNYHLYGLHVSSDFPLNYPAAEAWPPGLTDLKLVQASADDFSKAVSRLEPEMAEAWCRYAQLPDGSIYLSWPGLFQFLISSNGRQIAGRQWGDISWEAFQTYLLGQVLSFALIKQGIEPFHCTALVTAGRAFGLLGDCGYGKSTLAAACLRAGFSLLTDDLLVLKEEDQRFLAYPSFPRIKLFPEMARALLGDSFNGVPMNPFTPKLIIPLGPDRSCQEPARIEAFFVLRPPRAKLPVDRISLRTLRSRGALMALMKNTFNVKVTEPGRLKRLLAWSAKLAASIPIKSLSYPRDPERLPEVVEKIRLSLLG
jgi:hypothetical protein